MTFVKIVQCLVLTALLCLIQAPLAFAENKLAFVVGINSYQKLGADAQLHHAVNDADAVESALVSIGFAVTKITSDASLPTILSRFGTFQNTIQPGDTVLFYFAGHGIALDDGTYLLPGDVPPLTPTDAILAKRVSLSQREISESIRGSGARAIIIILDACRNNPFPRKGLRAIGASTRGLARVTSTEGVFTLYSARDGQTALDSLSDTDPSPNSVFTRTLVTNLKTPGLSLSDIGERVRDEVATVTRSVGHDQVPSVSNDLIGASRLYLAGASSAGTATASLTPADPHALAEGTSQAPRPVTTPFCARGDAYDKVIQTSGVEALRAYIGQCPDGQYREDANREFESRAFLAASECIRRAPGCDSEACLRGYDGDVPNGARASVLRAQASSQATFRASCRPSDPVVDSKPTQTRRDLDPPHTPPSWCRSNRLKPTEERICSDSELSELDDRINALFKDRLEATSGSRRADLERGEREWIGDRDRRCGGLDSDAMKTCLVGSVRARIAVLSNSGTGSPETFTKPAWCRNIGSLKATEVAICGDPRLAGLDGELNRLYGDRLQGLSGSRRTGFIQSEGEWLRDRDRRCGQLSSSGMRDCLVGSLRARIAVLGN